MYSPESFASADAIHDTIEQLKRPVDIDRAYYAKQQEDDADFRDKMSRVDPEYLKAWGGPTGDDLAQAATWQLEQQWFSSTTALYDYAAAHQREIAIQNGKLSFATTAAQTGFTQRQEYSKTLYAKWQERFQGLSREKQQERTRMVIPSDVPTPR